MRTTLAALTMFSIGLSGCNSAPQKKVDTFAEQQEQYRNSDCAGGVFTPRKFPMGMINISAIYETEDPNNSATGSVYAKCVEGKNNEHHICGVVARRNSVGYIDHAKKFYGIYYLDQDPVKSFSISATGERAESICRKLGM